MSDRLKRLCRIAVLAAGSAVISTLERPLLELLPLPLPGFKLGLANIAVLFAAYRLSRADAAAVLGVRILIVNLLFGNPTSLALALCGGAGAIIPTVLLSGSKKLSPVGVSAAASAAHMAGQICAAAFILKTPGLFVTYLPWLLLLSVPTGVLNGVLSRCLIRRIPPSITR